MKTIKHVITPSIRIPGKILNKIPKYFVIGELTFGNQLLRETNQNGMQRKIIAVIITV